MIVGSPSLLGLQLTVHVTSVTNPMEFETSTIGHQALTSVASAFQTHSDAAGKSSLSTSYSATQNEIASATNNILIASMYHTAADWDAVQGCRWLAHKQVTLNVSVRHTRQDGWLTVTNPMQFETSTIGRAEMLL